MAAVLAGIQRLFPTALRMSISASILVLVVVLLRFLLRKAPKWTICFLWLLVAVRLICPILPESRTSLMPQEAIREERLQGVMNIGLPVIEFETPQDHATNQGLEDVGQNVRVGHAASPREYLPVFWAVGVVLMLLYALISFLRLKRRVAVTAKFSDGVLLCDEIDSPFILGIFRPCIYLPSGFDEPQLSYVLAHERAHLKRRDHWWKPLGFLLLSVYWFNPVLWLAYVLLCRDIEMACDEKVICELEREERAAYSQTLLNCSAHRMLAACPVAFGEVGVKERVKAVLNYKKPAFWIIVTAVAACIVLALYFLTNPGKSFKISRAEVEKVTYFNMFIGDDCQGELNPNQIDEMVDRFSGVSKANRSSRYEGMTPGYQLCVYLQNGSLIYANGYHANHTNNDTVEIVFHGKRYMVSDPEFAQYLRNVCSGNNVSQAFYLTIGAEGVKSIEVKTQYTSGGCQNADGSLYRKGEQVWLEPLSGRNDLRGVTVTAIGENGNEIWTAAIPNTEDNKGFTRLTQDGWTISNLANADGASSRRMTLEDVRTLAAKGKALTWEDLRPFEGEDVGSGLFVYRYPINDTFILEARGGSLEEAPMSVLLLAADETDSFRPTVGYSIDIRTEDIDAFVSAQANKVPFLTVTSNGRSVAAHPVILYERTWTEDGWLEADGAPAAAEMMEHPDRIPTVTLGDDFSVAFGGGAVRKSSMNVYDEQFTPLRESWYGDTALHWLDPGTYYCVIEVHGPLGRYISSEDAYEESAYSCIFRLRVTENGTAPYTPEEAHDLVEARLHTFDKDYVLTDAAALAKLESWMKNATVLPGGAGCPFGSLLTLTRSDGSKISLCPAEDSCGTVFANGVFYRYAHDNADFWKLFDIQLNP